MKKLLVVAIALLAAIVSDAPCKAASKSDNDVTFVVASDLHYDANRDNSAMQKHIDRLNSLPGTPYPASVGGTVDAFRVVIVNGDLTNRGVEADWKLFVADWGLSGEKRCKFPIYEGFGNHDRYHGDVIRDHVKERNKLRKGLTNVSENGCHYSWDMGGVHFIQANLVAADDGKLNPELALSFVKSDLEKHIGDSGRPVVLNQHYAPLEPLKKSSREWSLDNRKALAEVLAKYNVIGIFCGHSHGYMHAGDKRIPNPNYEQSKFHNTQIDLFDDGSLRDDGARPNWKDSGRFFVVHIKDATMTVIQHMPKGWGTPHIKTFFMGVQSEKRPKRPRKECIQQVMATHCELSYPLLDFNIDLTRGTVTNHS